MKHTKSAIKVLFILISYACTGTFFSGCTDNYTNNGTYAEESFSIKSEDMGMQPSSRISNFGIGTQYAVWADSRNENGEAVLENKTVSQIEANGRLEATNPNTFKGIMDFYALTWGTEDVPNAKLSDKGIYTFYHKRDDNNKLPDLYRAENKGLTVANTGGNVVLPFEHTLVKLRYEVMRQDTDELKNAVIASISICDHAEGQLNVKSGEYSYSDGGTLPLYTVHPGEIPLTTSPVELKDGENPLETLVFPNNADSGDWFTVNVKVKKNETETFEKTYKIPSTTDGNSPFAFMPNHEYVLQLTVMTDDVRIIAIVPQKYDWIPVDDNKQPLGTPMVFANAVWLDRNLGANNYDINSTATFDDAVGYFYQTCRNVPYWPFCWKHRTNADHYPNGTPTAELRYKVPLSQGDVTWNEGDYRPYPIASDRLQQFLNMAEGNKEWVYNSNENSIYRTYTILEPEEAENMTNYTYSFIVGAENNNEIWWSRNNDKAKTRNRGEVDYAKFWQDPADQPVPDGWSIPTKEQFMAIFPTTPFAGNVSFLNTGRNSTPSNWAPSNDQSALFPDSIEVIRMCVPYYRDGGNSWHQHMDKPGSPDQGCVPTAEEYKEIGDYKRPNHELNKNY